MERWKLKFQELFGIDVRSLAFFRIGIALVILGDLFVRVSDLAAHYSDEGVLPRSILIDSILVDPWYFSIHLLNGTWQVQLLLFILTGLCALALLVGYHTRLATFFSWLLVISLQNRNPMVLQGGDIVLKVLLFWALFLPLGARWSIDQWLGRGKKVQNQILSAGTCALLLQICFIYWFSALLKTDPSWRQEGTAIWYTLNIEQYSTPLGLELLHYPALLKILTFATFYLEAFGPFFAFFPYWTAPLRFITAMVFIFFHLIGLNLAMELALFPYICAVAWIVFIPGWFWDKIFRERERPQTVWKASFSSNIVASFFLLYTFFWNLYTLELALPSPPSSFFALGPLFGIDQIWNMFAPAPLKEDGWYVIPGLLKDGSSVDLFSNTNQVSWQKPPSLAALYKNDRWRSYMMNLLLMDEFSEINTKYYAKYLCTHWNETHSFDQQLLSFDIYFMLKVNSLEHSNSIPEKIFLWHQECSSEHAWR